MPGGGKKAVFPPLAFHDHDQVRMSTCDPDRQKKLLQNRGKSLESKETLEKCENSSKCKTKCSAGKSLEKVQNCKSDQQKASTKSEQKAQQKLEQQQIKSEQKAQQKLEKEQHKLEKEQQREQIKLEKEQIREQIKLEKEQKLQMKMSSSKGTDKSKGAEHLVSMKDTPQLKTQKSVDLSFLKYHKSVEGSPKHPARKSVDMQYSQDLLESAEFSTSFSSIQLKSKK